MIERIEALENLSVCKNDGERVAGMNKLKKGESA